MQTRPFWLYIPCCVVLLCPASSLPAQAPRGSALPATPPTLGTPAHTVAPLAALPDAGDRPGERPHHAQVTCNHGQLEIRAENSSLNGILRDVSRCTGMRITGGVPEQRVFGNYGPAAPATVLATLIDGTGSNMLLRETAADQPAELILTPRMGGPTPPSPSTYADADTDTGASNAPGYRAQPYPSQPSRYAVPPGRPPMRPGLPQNLPARQNANAAPANQTPVPQPYQGSAVTSPPSIPQPINNVNGSPSNTSPTASTYPTTNSVPLDSIATPSTTPSTNGIVDAPNPPPAGSDTAAAMSGAPVGTPGTTNINPGATSPTTTPGATNTTLPAENPQEQQAPGQTPAQTTPEQIFQQLQQRQQQQQQRQQQQQQQTSPQ